MKNISIQNHKYKLLSNNNIFSKILYNNKKKRFNKDRKNRQDIQIIRYNKYHPLESKLKIEKDELNN